MPSKSIHVLKSQDFVLFESWGGFPGGSVVQNLPDIARDMRDLGSMGREDPLEKGRETNSRILAWRIPCTQEPGRLQSMGRQSQPWLSWLSMHVFSLIWLVAPLWLSQTEYTSFFILPTSIIIFSWKAFYFEYSTVHTSIPNSPLSVPPLFPSGNSKFVL